MGSNVPGKVRTFLAWAGGGPPYFEAVRDVVDNGYRGFRFVPGDIDAVADASGEDTVVGASPEA